MTSPLVPPDVDLRGLPWMRLDTARILDSDLFALSTGDEFKAAVALWCKSWTQRPAASLPDDDRILAHLSGAGARWKKVKAMALRGWVPCDDGRLYHPVVAEQALAAWEERLAYQEREGNKGERRKRSRTFQKGLREELRALGIVMPWDAPIATLRAELERAGGSPAAVACRVFGSDCDGPDDVTGHEPETDLRRTGDAPGTAKTGEGEGEGISKPPDRSLARAADAGAPAEVGIGFEGHDERPTDPQTRARIAIVGTLRRLGISGATACTKALKAYAAEGGTAEHIAQVAEFDRCRGKNAAYLLSAARDDLIREAPAGPTHRTTNGASHARQPRSAADRVLDNIVRRRAAEGAASEFLDGPDVIEGAAIRIVG